VNSWHQAADLAALAAFWVAGGEIDWAGLYPVSGQRRRCVSAPTYAFARRRYWFDPVSPGTAAAAEPAPSSLPEPIADVRPAATAAAAIPLADPSPTPSPASTSTLKFICATVASLVNLEPGELAPSASLADLGLDSIQGMHLVRAIQERFSLPLHANEVMAQPDLASLASYVDGQVAPALPAPPAEAPLARAAAPALVVSPAGAAEFPVASPAATRVTTRPILFVLSAPRSGSTLLRVMLAGHSRLFCPPELHLLPFQDMRQRSRALSGKMKFLNEGLVRAVMDLKKCSAPEATALVADLEARNASVAEVFNWLQELAGDRLLVDKSPSYGEEPAVLRNAARLDGNARYIFLTRHPGAVIESFVRNRFDKMLGHAGGDPWRLGEEVWTRINRNIAEFKGEVPADRWWDVRYEDLVTTPEESARELCRFLDVPFEPSLLTPYAGERMTDGVHAVSLSIGDPNFLKHDRIEAGLAEEWRSRLPATLALGAPTIRLAAALGYPLDAQCRPFPALSPAQRLLLAESPADPRWHIVHRLRFAATAPIDRARFTQAWHDVIARHPRAHTLYQPQGDSVARDPAPLVEWTTRPPGDSAETAIAAMFARLNATVDARQGPLMRVVVLEGGDQGVELLWVVHHLAGDGLAGEILLREVLRTYAGLPLPALPRLTFDDYCRAAAAAETGPAWRLAREYWRERTQAPAFAVPADRPGGPARQEDERELQVEWPRRDQWPAGAFDHFSVALYQALGDWTGQPSPTLCHRLHGRRLAQRIYDGVFGFFAYDVPLALTLPDGAGGASLLRQFRAAFNQIPDIPYPSLVLADGLPPAHHRSAVRLNFQPLPALLTEGPLQVVSREIRTYLPPDAPRPYALDLIVRVGPDVATVIARYSASHYDAATLHRLLARWRDHLGQLAGQA
jgi:acyl carrier protein